MSEIRNSEKKCTKCGVFKNVKMFGKTQSWCKKCRNNYSTEQRRKQKEKLRNSVGSKICPKCNSNVQLKNFYYTEKLCLVCHKRILQKKRDAKRKLVSESTKTKKCKVCLNDKLLKLFKIRGKACRECMSKLNKKRMDTEKKIDEQKEFIFCDTCKKDVKPKQWCYKNKRCIHCVNMINREYRHNKKNLMDTLFKKCTQCNTVKDAKEHFSVVSNKCKKCVSIRKHERMNELKIMNIHKKCLKCNKSKHISKFGTLNGKPICKNCKGYHRHVAANVMSMIIKGKIKNPNTYYNELLQCSGKDFNTWTNINYDNKSNNSNHGSYWHFDHVIPIARFNTDNEHQISMCFGWFNTCPVEKITNSIKSDRLDKEALRKHYDKLNIFHIKPNKDYMKLLARLLDDGDVLDRNHKYHSTYGNISRGTQLIAEPNGNKFV